VQLAVIGSASARLRPLESADKNRVNIQTMQPKKAEQNAVYPLMASIKKYKLTATILNRGHAFHLCTQNKPNCCDSQYHMCATCISELNYQRYSFPCAILCVWCTICILYSHLAASKSCFTLFLDSLAAFIDLPQKSEPLLCVFL
jgi:hypothetical protein